MHTAQWDIFCKVIDNYGDIGVCWRLAADLAARGHRVRLWVDDAAALAWMAPGAQAGQWERITVCDWRMASEPATLWALEPADVWIEAFGCDIPPAFLAHHATRAQHDAPPAWINLEYLSAEPFAERAHRLPSPVMSGPAKGRTKHFFYPGFTPSSGGLLRENNLGERQAAFDRSRWLAAQGIHWSGEQLIALFCYEPAALAQWVSVWQQQARPTRLLVTHGRAHAAMRGLPAAARPSNGQVGRLAIDYLPALSQLDFDHLLWSCDLNLVRGEDSLVRALWAGKPFVWQIYPQHDKAHHAKLAAFLNLLEAPPSLRDAHTVWNGIDNGPMVALAMDSWIPWAIQNRQRLWAQSDLASRLTDFTAVVRSQGGRKAESR